MTTGAERDPMADLGPFIVATRARLSALARQLGEV
jgi:hypothetical protein